MDIYCRNCCYYFTSFSVKTEFKGKIEGHHTHTNSGFSFYHVTVPSICLNFYFYLQSIAKVFMSLKECIVVKWKKRSPSSRTLKTEQELQWNGLDYSKFIFKNSKMQSVSRFRGCVLGRALHQQWRPEAGVCEWDSLALGLLPYLCVCPVA